MPRPSRLAVILWIALTLISVLVLLAVNPAREERAIHQQRLDNAAPALKPGYTIGQTFYSTHAGLKAVAFTLVRYERPNDAPGDAVLLMHLERQDKPGRVITASVSIRGLVHNQEVRFDFSPLLDSRDAQYRMTLSTEQDYGLALWRSESDAYASGNMLENDAATAGDIRFSVYYAYTLRDMLADLGLQLLRWLPALIGLLLTLTLPGSALAPWLLPRKRVPWPEAVGLVLSLSLASWPLLFLWITAVRGSLSGWSIWIILAALLLVAISGWFRRWRALRLQRRDVYTGLPDVLLAVVLLLSLATRLLQVRELVLPNWVDSVHHTLLTELLSEKGFIPNSYLPYMPVENLHYHFGFHAAAAALVRTSSLASPQAVLLLGQLLGALAPLAVFILTAAVTGNRYAGAVAALITGCISYLPAYYATWGRYTHLEGLLLLCATLSVLQQLLAQQRTRLDWRQTTLCALLASGLCLAHYRAAIFAFVWAITLVSARLVTRAADRGRCIAQSAAAAILTLLLISPWIIRFLAFVMPAVSETYGGWQAVDGYNTFALNLVNGRVNHVLLGLGAFAMVWGLIRRHPGVNATSAWCVLCLVLANLSLVGLTDIWLLPNSAVVISYWVPASLLCGWVVVDFSVWLWTQTLRLVQRCDTWAVRLHPLTRWGHSILALLYLGAALCGSWRMADIINPITIQADEDDLAAMAWIKRNIPANARFLVNTRPWSGELHVGADAGWWLPYMTGHAVSMPSILHHQGTRAYREAVRDLALLVEGAASLDDPKLVEALRHEGITHVYIGSRGGTLLPARLDSSKHYQLLYSRGPTRVYAFNAGPG